MVKTIAAACRMCLSGLFGRFVTREPCPTATLQLPVEPLADVTQTHADSWNILKRCFAKRNENNTIETHDGTSCLVVRYPEGSINPGAPERPLGGLGFYAAPAHIFPARDVELRYKVAFDPSFQPQKGGKLPGLYLCSAEPGAFDTCGGSGGLHSDKHASCRLMWRDGFRAEAYVYSTAAKTSPDYKCIPRSQFTAKHGDSLWRGLLQFRAQGWNVVRLRLRLNTPGAIDGALIVTVNGTQCAFEEMAWRWTADTVITALFMSTFYGGATARFACPVDTAVRFRDFELIKRA